MKQRLFPAWIVSAALALSLTACDQANDEDTRQPGGMQDSEAGQDLDGSSSSEKEEDPVEKLQ
ncbi:MAG: hypothetical protein VX935_09850 [Pseudomonadota bacterium]|nr:hypothetical protein [Pseudomonadota bacterium]